MEIERSSQIMFKSPQNEVLLKSRKETLPVEVMIDLYKDTRYLL